MEDLGIVLSVLGLFGLTILSPGPDIVIVTRNSIAGGTRCGILTAAGITTGLLVHNCYCLFGVALLIRESGWLFNLFQVTGALYLLWLGYGIVRSALTRKADGEMVLAGGETKHPFRTGLLTNLLNIKVMLVFLLFYTTVLPERLGWGWRVVWGAGATVEALAVFMLAALFLTRPPVRRAFLRWGRWIDAVLGMLLIFCGVAMLASCFF